MPNYCDNRLCITGPKKDRESFMRDVRNGDDNPLGKRPSTLKEITILGELGIITRGSEVG